MASPQHPGRRRALRAATAAAASLATPALRAHEPAPGTAAALQIVGPWEISGLAPASSGHLFTRLQVAETLLGAHDDGTPTPALARQWSVSADGLAWRFSLRPGARFHDGTPVTAAAVAHSLRAARVAPALLSQAPIATIEAEDISTLRLRLAQPHAALPALLAHFSTLVLAPASYDGAGRVRAILGSGPYRVTRLAPPQEVEAVAFEGYDGPRPAVAQLRYLTASRPETRALMAASGQADLAWALDPMSLQRLRRHPRVRIESTLLPRTVMLKLNAKLPALADPRVRRALSLCIDRAGIAHALLRDPALAATQLLPPVLSGWHDPALPPLAHDPALAQRLLAEAGWHRGAEGLLDAQGRPLRLTLRTFPDRPELPLIATALQAQWRQAGIAVRVAVGNSGDVPLGHRDGSLELALAARNYASVPDPTGALLQDFGPQGGDWGAMGWSHPALNAALAALARGGGTADHRQALRARIAALLQAELPVIPVAWYRQQVAVSPRVAGVSLDPFELSYRITRMGWRT